MLAQMVGIAAQRSTCIRKQVGALIVLDGRILSTGYAGAPKGLPHCLDVGCIINSVDGGCMRTAHAESNAIAFAARHGIRVEGADLWCSLTPCLMCAKLLVNSGIRQVFALQTYRDSSGIELLHAAKIEVSIYA
jgi:dCMP deaminase